MKMVETKKRKKIHSVQEVILSSLKTKSLKEAPLFCIFILKNWSKVMGPKWKDISKPIKYHHGCLFIKVPSACHIQEMNFEKDLLISKIHKLTGLSDLKEIKFIS